MYSSKDIATVSGGNVFETLIYTLQVTLPFPALSNVKKSSGLNIAFQARTSYQQSSILYCTQIFG